MIYILKVNLKVHKPLRILFYFLKNNIILNEKAFSYNVSIEKYTIIRNKSLQRKGWKKESEKFYGFRDDKELFISF